MRTRHRWHDLPPAARAQVAASLSEPAEITVGAYTLRAVPGGGLIAIEHESGEGGEFSAERFAAAVGLFFAEEF